MSRFLDITLLSLTALALCFCWARYITHNNTLSLLLSLIVAICIAYILYFFTTVKKKRRGKRVSKKQLEGLFCFLNYCESLSGVWEGLLSYFHYSVTVVDHEHLLVKKDDLSTYVVLRFDTKALSQGQIRNAVIGAKRHQADKLLVFCHTANGAVLSTANQHLPTKIVDITTTYNLLQQASMLPLNTQVKSLKPSFVADYAFNKKRAKLWALNSIGAVLLSFVSYIAWWLLCWATVFAVIAVYCLINKKHNNACNVVSL